MAEIAPRKARVAGDFSTSGRIAVYMFCGLVIVTIGVTDLLVPRAHDVADLYVIAILIAGMAGRIRPLLAAAGACLGFTVTAFIARPERHSELPQSYAWVGLAVPCIVVLLATALVWRAIAATRRTSQLNQALLRSERARGRELRLLEAAGEITPIGTWSVSSDGSVEWSDAVAAILGFTDAAPPTRDEVINAVIAGDRQRLEKAMERAMLTGEPFREEVRIVQPSGKERWIVTLGERVATAQGAPVLLHGTIQDITQWREAESRADALSHRFAKFAEIMPIVIWTANPQGEIEYFNDQLLIESGREAEAYLGDAWIANVDPRDRDRIGKEWLHCVATGDAYDVEFRAMGPDGSLEWHHVAAMPERDDAGQIIRWWGSKVNITANRKLIERTEVLAQERETILESMLDGVYALDHDWTITYVNPAAERILGRKKEDAIGQRLWDLVALPTDHALRAGMGEAMYKRKAHVMTFHSERIDKWLDVAIAPSPMGVNAFFKDVTEVKQLSEQLAQAQRLESIGQLTGGIAHDFNNLLTVVVGGADALKEAPELADESRETVDLIEAAAVRGAELTHRLLSFARRQPLQPKAVDLDGRIASLEPLLRRTLGEDVDLMIATASGTPPAEVDPGQFDNALLNLAINARDAMPHGGRLTIEVSTVTLDETYTTTHAEVAPGSYALVAVSDSGVGIAPEHIGRLFDPFFTTKGAGKGSGMGLAMVWGFITQSGGHVGVYSEVGHGTSIKLYLPLAPGQIELTDTAAIERLAVPSGGIVLVAEDDDLVRTFAAHNLRSHGFDVVEAASGPEALDALAHLPHIDLLFTDVIMPGGMTGRQLADEVLKLRPHTPVLYASGYTENVVIHNGRLDPGVKLLAKPYSSRQLLHRVSSMIVVTEQEAP